MEDRNSVKSTEKMRFTDEECEFIRKGEGPTKKRAFMFKVKGAAGGSVRVLDIKQKDHRYSH